MVGAVYVTSRLSGCSLPRVKSSINAHARLQRNAFVVERCGRGVSTEPRAQEEVQRLFRCVRAIFRRQKLAFTRKGHGCGFRL